LNKSASITGIAFGGGQKSTRKVIALPSGWPRNH
jgi:hypothetical protein